MNNPCFKSSKQLDTEYLHSILFSFSVQEVINTGFFHMKSLCRNCQGQGRIVTVKCRSCMGKGSKMRTQTLDVQIPAGKEEGERGGALLMHYS